MISPATATQAIPSRRTRPLYKIEGESTPTAEILIILINLRHVVFISLGGHEHGRTCHDCCSAAWNFYCSAASHFYRAAAGRHYRSGVSHGDPRNAAAQCSAMGTDPFPTIIFSAASRHDPLNSASRHEVAPRKRIASQIRCRARACCLHGIRRMAVARGGAACKKPRSRPASAGCLVAASCRNGKSRTVPHACVAESVAATRILRPLFVTCQPAGDGLHDRRVGTANPNCPGINGRIGSGSSVLPMYFGSVV